MPAPLPSGEREVRAAARGGSNTAAQIPDHPEHYVEVLNVIGRYSQADFEIQAALPHLHPGTVSKRRLRLERARLIEEVPEVMRATPHGVPAMTFRITPTGKETLRAWQQQQSEQPTSSGPTLPTTPASTDGCSTPSVTPPESGRSFDVV